MDDRAAMPERLAAFLSAVDPDRGRASCVHYEPMAGGYSRSMARATVTWSDGSTTVTETVVLRGDPPPGQALIETDRDAEWLVHQALTQLGALDLPAARYYDATGEHLGTKCIVMDFCEGESLQTWLEGRDDLAEQAILLAEQLAQIHQVRVADLPAELERPPDPERVIDDLIDLWEVIDRQHVNNSPIYRYVNTWLRANRPAPMPPTLVHGDFQNPNIMIDGAGERRMIDWEFAHIGDPREDIGWYNLYSSVAGTNLYQADPAGFLARYRELTGFDPADVNEWTVGYFTIVAAAKVAYEVLNAINGLATGAVRSTMAAHQAVGAITTGNGIYLDLIAGLEQAEEAS